MPISSMTRRMILLTLCVTGICDSARTLAEEPTGELAEKLAKVEFEHYAEGPGYSEGPIWRKGEVFFCSGGLLRVDKDRKVHPYLDVSPAGTVLREDGHLLVCDNKHKVLLEVSPSGNVKVIVEQFETRPLRSLNDLTIDARGNVYWTDPEGSSVENPIGNVFRVRPDGRVDLLATGLAFPNGIEVDPANQYLFVIESQSKKILRYTLPADDDLLGPAEVFYDLGGSGGDGCTFDAAGNLWVTDFHRPETGKGRITVLSPEAKVLAYLPIPAKVVSNITFGGENHDEIFCTTGEPPGVFHAVVGVKSFAGHPGKTMRSVRELDVVIRELHPDAEALRQIMKIAAEANAASGHIDNDSRAQIEEILASLKNSKLLKSMPSLMNELDRSAMVHAGYRPLLGEVERLHGQVKYDVKAPRELRAIVGDEGLHLFGRITEVYFNERTDGHKEPEKKAVSDRCSDETMKLIAPLNHLRRLEISGTAVTSAGLKHLEFLTHLQFLNVCLTAVDDEGLAHLSRLKNMRRMTVCSSKITGSGFKHLKGMEHLESINLHSSPASDEGLEAIGNLTSLKRLEIVHTHVTDAGLAHLEHLTNLRQLHIHGPETTEAGLPFIGKLQKLYELDIYDRPASNQTLVEIAKLPNLRFLRLFNGIFDDAGVKHLAQLTTLEELVLNSAHVTDGSVEHLAGLKRLRKISLSGSKITDAAKERLKTLLPKVEIVQ